MKRPTKQQLRDAGIVNPHEFSRFGVALTGMKVPPFIYYRAAERGRMARASAWQVVRTGFRTDPAAGHWMDGGNKTFDCFGSPAAEVRGMRLTEAKTWASERYGVTAWERDPFGSWHPTQVVEAVFAAVARGERFDRNAKTAAQPR